jgi:thiol-disulfide isomerase/thioredoxin
LALAACGDAPATPFVPASDRPTFVFFVGPDCSLCAEMRPVVEELKTAYQHRIAFVELDATTNGKAVLESYQLNGYPSYLLLRPDGSMAWYFLGVRTREEMAAEIERVSAQP